MVVCPLHSSHQALERLKWVKCALNRLRKSLAYATRLSPLDFWKVLSEFRLDECSILSSVYLHGQEEEIKWQSAFLPSRPSTHPLC